VLSRMGVDCGVVLCTVGEVGRMEGDATARLLVAGGWRLEVGPNSCIAIGRVGAREKG
jgi:hypothetical protein